MSWAARRAALEREARRDRDRGNATLEAHALRPGLDAPALRQHFLANGFAAIVDALLSPAVDSGFIKRCSDPNVPRREWVHVIGMLLGGTRPGLAEASNALLSDVSVESWDRLLAASERALREGLFGYDRV